MDQQRIGQFIKVLRKENNDCKNPLLKELYELNSIKSRKL